MDMQTKLSFKGHFLITLKHQYYYYYSHDKMPKYIKMLVYTSWFKIHYK